MIIPKGASHLKFYKKAIREGQTIESRYTGVSAKLDSKNPIWLAKSESKGKQAFLARFPFTAKGERDASKAYLEFAKENGIRLRNKNKPSFNKEKEKKEKSFFEHDKTIATI